MCMGVRGCVNAMCLSSRYDTPRLARKLTFLRPTRLSKEQIAKFDSTSKVFFFFFSTTVPKNVNKPSEARTSGLHV